MKRFILALIISLLPLCAFSANYPASDYMGSNILNKTSAAAIRTELNVASTTDMAAMMSSGTNTVVSTNFVGSGNGLTNIGRLDNSTTLRSSLQGGGGPNAAAIYVDLATAGGWLQDNTGARALTWTPSGVFSLNGFTGLGTGLTNAGGYPYSSLFDTTNIVDQTVHDQLNNGTNTISVATIAAVTVTASGGFAGVGTGLIAVPAGQLTGLVPLARLSGITASQLTPLAITTAAIANEAVTIAKISTDLYNLIVYTNLGSLTITNTDGSLLVNLNANQLTSGLVPLNRLTNITETQLAPSTISTNKIDAIFYEFITDTNIVAEWVNSGTLPAARIGASSLTTNKIDATFYSLLTVPTIANSSISTNKVDSTFYAFMSNTNTAAESVNSGTLPAARIGANSLSTNKIDATFYSLLTVPTIASGSISTNKIDSTFYAFIAAAQLADGSLTTNKINANFYTLLMDTNIAAERVNSGTLPAARIGASSLTTNKIDSTFYSLLTSPTIANGSISTNKVDATFYAFIAAAQLADGSLTTNKINANFYTLLMNTNTAAEQVNSGTLPAARIGANSLTTNKIDATFYSLLTTPTIASGSISTNKIDSTFYAWIQNPVVSSLTISSLIVTGGVFYATNLADTTSIDFTKASAFVSTNNNISITGCIGVSNMYYQSTVLIISNSSASAKTLTLAAPFQDMDSAGNTRYITNVAKLEVWQHVGAGTNFTFKSR